MLDESPAITSVVIAAALDGDMQAAGMVLSRTAPALKSQAERVQFDLSPNRPLGEQAQEVLQAIAAGLVDPETGKMLISCVQAVAGIKAVEELEQRIIELEAKHI